MRCVFQVCHNCIFSNTCNVILFPCSWHEETVCQWSIEREVCLLEPAVNPNKTVGLPKKVRLSTMIYFVRHGDEVCDARDLESLQRGLWPYVETKNASSGYLQVTTLFSTNSDPHLPNLASTHRNYGDSCWNMTSPGFRDEFEFGWSNVQGMSEVRFGQIRSIWCLLQFGGMGNGPWTVHSRGVSVPGVGKSLSGVNCRLQPFENRWVPHLGTNKLLGETCINSRT